MSAITIIIDLGQAEVLVAGQRMIGSATVSLPVDNIPPAGTE